MTQENLKGHARTGLSILETKRLRYRSFTHIIIDYT